MGNCFGQTGWSWNFSRSNDDDDQEPIIIDENESSTTGERSIFQILKFKRRRMGARKLIRSVLPKPVPLMNYVELGGRSREERGRDESHKRGVAEISMQFLDAKSLLTLARGEQDRQMQYKEFIGADSCTANSSQYGSSLDLEWENDYDGLAGTAMAASNNQTWIRVREPLDKRSLPDKSPSSLSSDSSEKKDNSVECSAKMHERKGHSWSRVSTPDSMEWDVVTEDNRLKSEDCDSVDQDTKDLLHEIEQLKNRALEETGQFDYDMNKYSDGAETES